MKHWLSIIEAHDELSCVKADGSSYLRWPFNSKNDTQEERGEEEKGDQTSTSSTTSDASTISGKMLDYSLWI